MWRDAIESLTDDAKYAPPASETDLAQAETRLGVKLPPELRKVLLESNGVRAHYGTDLIWTVERIVKDNMEFRSNSDFKELYMPFDCLLFFGDNGSGDQFAYRITSTGVENARIYMWDHETDGRPCYAYSIERYLRQVLTFEEE